MYIVRNSFNSSNIRLYVDCGTLFLKMEKIWSGINGLKLCFGYIHVDAKCAKYLHLNKDMRDRDDTLPQSFQTSYHQLFSPSLSLCLRSKGIFSINWQMSFYCQIISGLLGTLRSFPLPVHRVQCDVSFGPQYLLFPPMPQCDTMASMAEIVQTGSVRLASQADNIGISGW